MKITIEGPTFRDILEQIEGMLVAVSHGVPKNISETVSEKPKKNGVPTNGVQGPGPEPKVEEKWAQGTPVDNPVEEPPKKPVDDRIAKMQAAKKAKAAERAAAAAAAAAAPPVDEPDKKAQVLGPAELVALRTKTIEELQAAYANGKQQEVFELLSRFGDGAKSFRELKPEAFVPIREAIDLGALT